MMKTRFPVLIAFFAVAVLAVFTSAATMISTSGEFNVSPSPLYINWTNSSGKASTDVYAENITITNNNLTHNISINITNTTGTLNNSLFIPMNFSVNNGTAFDNNLIFLANGTSLNVTLLANITGMPAGRYSGNVTLMNATNASENITTFVVYVDVPININQTTRIGNFSGNVSNTSTDKYYFNITPFQNVAGIRVDVRDINAAAAIRLYDNVTGNSILRNSTVLNATTNSTNITLASLFPLTGIWLIDFTSNNTTSSDNVTFNASIELLQSSLRVNTTTYPNGTFDDDVTDNLQNITVKANPGLNYSQVIAAFVINNTADYNLVVTNITLEAPNNKMILNGTTVNLVLGNNTTAATLLNVAQIGNQLNATFLLSNASNTSQNKTVNMNETAANDTNWDGSTVGASYIQLYPTPMAVLWLGAPVTGSSNLTKGANWINYTLSLTNLTVYNGTTNTSTFTITLNTSNTANSQGIYSGWALIHTTNGYPYRAFKLGLFVNLVGELNVTVNNVTNATDGSSITLPGVNITLNVTPRYLNGNLISNLTSTSSWLVWATPNSNASLVNQSLKTINLTVINVTNDTSLNYYINATIPSYALGGNYTVYAFVKDINTANMSSGVGSFSNLTVNETALSLRSSSYSTQPPCDGLSGITIIPIGTAFYCGYNVTNYGFINGTDVTVTRSVSGCSKLDSLPDTINLGNITPGGSNTTSTNTTTTWYFNASSTGICTINVTAVASGTRWDRQSLTVIFNVTSGSGGSGDGAGQPNVTINTTKGLDITSWPNETYVYQGGSASATITVKNTGALSISDVRLNVTGIDDDWYSVSPVNMSLNRNQEKSFIVTFNVPNNASVGNYSIVYTAWAKDVSNPKVSKLIVYPSNATQAQINISLENYTSKYNELLAMLNMSNVTGNKTEAAQKLADAKILIEQAQAAINAGDWLTANELLDKIEVALLAAETALKTKVVKQIVINIPWMWVGIIAAVACIVGAAFYLMRLRKPGYYPELGYRASPPAGTFFDRIRNAMQRLKEKFRRRQVYSA